MSSKNTVTIDRVKTLIDSAQTQEHIFWDKELVISYKLVSGFTVLGRAACVDPANFDLSIGRKICRENAEHQIWQLEGYTLQTRLYEEGVL
jgi:hypothetical protein